LTREEIEASVKLVPFWWHSIDLGSGVITPGAQPHEFWRLRSLQLPDVHGKTVLDIGAYDGYSFAVERPARPGWSPSIITCGRSS
jgi:tRNA (mo5U34)-methyltransferase